MSKISVVQMNSGLACSSLLIGYTWTPLDFSKKSLGDFAKELSEGLNGLAQYNSISWAKMSFVVASTADSLGEYDPYDSERPAYDSGYLNITKGDFYERLDVSKKHYEFCLQELGFTPTEAVYNEKNETTVRLWTIPVPKLKERLKAYG